MKWKAARFLIANMKDKFAYNVPELDNIRQAMIDVKTKNAIEKRWKIFLIGVCLKYMMRRL